MPHPREIIEARIGIQSIEELHHKRRMYIAEHGTLRAICGPFGTWEHTRKTLLATLREKQRAKNVALGIKSTEAAIDDVAHAHPDYIAFITLATENRTTWITVENEILEINDLIYRDNAMIYHATAEMKLQ